MATTMDLQTAAVLGALDEFSYNPGGLPLPGQQMPSGWEPIPINEGGSMVEGSFSAYAYRNTKTGQIAITYTGTNGLGDVVPDLATLNGKWSNQFTLATDFAARIKEIKGARLDLF